MIPTVGRIVHYTNLGDKDGKYPPETQAAIITSARVRSGVGGSAPEEEENRYHVSLHIFYPTGQFDMVDVTWSKEPKGGHWSWPPRV